MHGVNHGWHVSDVPPVLDSLTMLKCAIAACHPYISGLLMYKQEAHPVTGAPPCCGCDVVGSVVGDYLGGFAVDELDVGLAVDEGIGSYGVAVEVHIAYIGSGHVDHIVDG